MRNPSPASEAARALSMQRWGDQRPRRLAAELSARAHELSPSERARLIEALQDQQDVENPR